jgi:hypothetical protein
VAKKRKLNSKNPKYWPKESTNEPEILEKTLIYSRNPKAKVYKVFLK